MANLGRSPESAGGSEVAHIPAGNRSAELALGADLRQQLGLSPDEMLSVLNTSAHFVLLERSGGTRSFAVPWDRSLVLCAPW